MPQRFEGRNLEEALTSAGSALGVERYQIRYSVLLEKRGFLGGVKRVVIEADINPDAPQAVPPVPEATTTPYAHSQREPRPSRAERTRGRGRRVEGEPRGRRGRREEPMRPNEGRRSPQPLSADVPPQGEESAAAKSVREWCEKVLDLARLDLAIRTEERESQIVVRLYGADARRMIDRHGELLDALQVLANKAVVGRATEKDIEIDCESFKEQRHGDLEQRARDAADRVRSEKREYVLPAMSPIERRIVHLALRDDADVTTESRGDGFYKRVAIILRPAGSLPQPEETAPPQP
ncbi:MAG TPA: R3H domain-containing nucleic acid-binding protein [Thermoanaerobaculia bacterium]|nr:R3H domain-containing nucleic acid-binding protein [Thermoanaerobaculia bacterium]